MKPLPGIAAAPLLFAEFASRRRVFHYDSREEVDLTVITDADSTD